MTHINGHTLYLRSDATARTPTAVITRYLVNKWFKIGFWLAVAGWGPLLVILLLAAIGLWPDPDPNPVGPGLLFFLTFWPAVICMVVGVRQIRRG